MFAHTKKLCLHPAAVGSYSSKILLVACFRISYIVCSTSCVFMKNNYALFIINMHTCIWSSAGVFFCKGILCCIVLCNFSMVDRLCEDCCQCNSNFPTYTFSKHGPVTFCIGPAESAMTNYCLK